MLILSIIVCALESGEITNGNERREKGRGSNSSRLPSMNQQFEIFLFFQVEVSFRVNFEKNTQHQRDPPISENLKSRTVIIKCAQC